MKRLFGGVRSMKNRAWTRACLFTALAALLAAAWMSLCVGRVDFGAKVMLALTLAALLCAAVRRDTRGARFFRRLCADLLALALVFVLAMSVGMNVYADRRAAGETDAPYAVVFGAGVKGETPSLLLTLRTRAAYEYLQAHPDTKAVLTGGVGDDASISEAEAMRRLLTAWGIAEDRLIPEPDARNTAENGWFAMKLIGEGQGPVVSVSNAFHQYRCVKALTNAGAAEVWTVNAPLPSRGVAVSMYLRECVAIVYHAVFG